MYYRTHNCSLWLLVFPPFLDYINSLFIWRRRHLNAIGRSWRWLLADPVHCLLHRRQRAHRVRVHAKAINFDAAVPLAAIVEGRGGWEIHLWGSAFKCGILIERTTEHDSWSGFGEGVNPIWWWIAAPLYASFHYVCMCAFCIWTENGNGNGNGRRGVGTEEMGAMFFLPAHTHIMSGKTAFQIGSGNGFWLSAFIFGDWLHKVAKVQRQPKSGALHLARTRTRTPFGSGSLRALLSASAMCEIGSSHVRMRSAESANFRSLSQLQILQNTLDTWAVCGGSLPFPFWFSLCLPFIAPSIIIGRSSSSGGSLNPRRTRRHLMDTSMPGICWCRSPLPLLGQPVTPNPKPFSTHIFLRIVCIAHCSFCPLTCVQFPRTPRDGGLTSHLGGLCWL